MEYLESPELFVLGCFLLLGYIAHALGSLSHVPRVILLLLVGLLAGPAGFNLVPAEVEQWFPLVSQAALSVVGFELGEKFLGNTIRTMGRALLGLSIIKVIGTALVVLLILLLIGIPLPLALILAGIAPATDPVATADVINEARARGELTDTTLRLVALDDAWGVILFSLLLATATMFSGMAPGVELIWGGLREILGALLLGVILGIPMAWLTGRVQKGELTLMETLGFVFVCGGLAASLELSYILASMTMGCVVTNLAQHHKRPFHAIKNVHQPFLVMFFLLAGYQADPGALLAAGLLSGTYMVARSLGSVGAGYVGAAMTNYSATIKLNIGLCMLPQAGVAIGLGLLAAERFPDLSGEILSVAIGTSVLFEIIGPIFTRQALNRAGEIPES